MTVARSIRQHKWSILAASALGLVVFQVLGVGVEALASGIDGAVYTHAAAPLRENLVRYRVWELYRAVLSSASAAFCGWMVAAVFGPSRRLAVASVAVTIAASLLISLLTGPGYYLRDLALIAAIAGSPLVGARFVRNGNEHIPHQMAE